MLGRLQHLVRPTALRIEIEPEETGECIVSLFSEEGVEEVYAPCGIDATLDIVRLLIPKASIPLAQIRSEPYLGRAA